MDEKMLSANELAEMLNISVYTVHRLVHKVDGLKGYKVGGVTRFKPSEVEAYLTANVVKPAEKPQKFSSGRFTYVPGMKVVSI